MNGKLTSAAPGTHRRAIDPGTKTICLRLDLLYLYGKHKNPGSHQMQYLPPAPRFCAPWSAVCAALLLAAIPAAPAPAQTPPQSAPQSTGGYEDFTFRRIAPDATRSGPRITVQIDPAEQARRLAAAPRVPPPQAAPTTPGAATTPATGAHGWFWHAVSPDIAQGAGRFALAVNTVGNAPPGSGLTAPRMQFMQNIAQAHGPQILRATIGTQVSPALVLAIIAVESAGQPRAVSSAGAQGLMQLIPATAARFGVTDSFDPTQNIKGGVQYLDWLMGHFERDAVLAIAAYNAGEGAVRRNNGVPPFAETRDYVPKVLAAWTVARGLCVTPPELPSDGCVFKVGQAG